jgi:hypothetical protein
MYLLVVRSIFHRGEERRGEDPPHMAFEKT